MTTTIDIRTQKIKTLLKQDKIYLSDLIETMSRKSVTKIDFTLIENDISRQEFRDLLFLIHAQNKPYKPNSASAYHTIRLAGFMSNLNGITQIPDDQLREMFHMYCDKNKLGTQNKKIILSCKHALLDYYDHRKGFERDVWDESIFVLPEERINKTASKVTFNFRLVESVHNRELLKKYIKYLIGNTERTLMTISNTFYVLNSFFDYIKDTKFDDVTSDDIYAYLEENRDLALSSYNKIVKSLNEMYEYLIVKKLVTITNPVKENMYRKDKQELFENTVDEFTVLQIFNHLHTAPFSYMLIYLINYCTGMRISDVCQLRTDCLYEDGNGGYYVRPYICQKMQKTIMNLIPKALYELIQEQIKVINNLDYDELYLFPSDKEKLRPYVSQTYRNNFKKLCKEWGIKNEDGSDYDYVTHAYRHTIATELHVTYKVPIVVIQKAVLWHQEIQMSYRYIEKNMDFRKMNADKYFSKTGESELAEWTKESLKSHVLPNGICGKSTKLEKCPAVDACLSCEYFVTSKRFLSVHKAQLATIKARLPIYEANGWKPNIETAKRQIIELENLIARLETEEDADGNKEITNSISTTPTTI